MSFWNQFRQMLFPGANLSAEQLADACFWRVDMHSHLVPGIDDGVTDIEQTLEVLQQYVEWGIQHVITTPHVSRDYHPNSTATLLEGRAQLQALVNEHELPLTIDVAAEYLVDDFFPDQMMAGDVLTFGKEKYLLFETGWAASPTRLDSLVFQMQTHGYTPVLAHPERYKYYVDEDATLQLMHNNGCLFQLNWGSLVGRYGSRAQSQAKKFIRNGWVDFIGSDLHRPEDLALLAQLFTTPEYEQLRQMPLRNMGLIVSD